MTINITVNYDQGDSIEEAVAQAIALANRIHVKVQFEFNGVTCVVLP